MRIEKILSDDLLKLRGTLITYHRELDQFIQKYLKDEKELKSPLGKMIETRPYSLKKYDENSKMMTYKDSTFHIPNSILDEIVDFIKKNPKIATGVLKIKINELKTQQRHDSNRSISTFKDPLNTTAFGVNSMQGMNSSKNINLLSKSMASNADISMQSVANEAIPQSTPKKMRKESEKNSRKRKDRSMSFQTSISDFGRLKKNARSTQIQDGSIQEGKGVRRKWERI